MEATVNVKKEVLQQKQNTRGEQLLAERTFSRRKTAHSDETAHRRNNGGHGVKARAKSWAYNTEGTGSKIIERTESRTTVGRPGITPSIPGDDFQLIWSTENLDQDGPANQT